MKFTATELSRNPNKVFRAAYDANGEPITIVHGQYNEEFEITYRKRELINSVMREPGIRGSAKTATAFVNMGDDKQNEKALSAISHALESLAKPLNDGETVNVVVSGVPSSIKDGYMCYEDPKFTVTEANNSDLKAGDKIQFEPGHLVRLYIDTWAHGSDEDAKNKMNFDFYDLPKEYHILGLPGYALYALPNSQFAWVNFFNIRKLGFSSIYECTESAREHYEANK